MRHTEEPDGVYGGIVAGQSPPASGVVFDGRGGRSPLVILITLALHPAAPQVQPWHLGNFRTSP